MSKIIDGLYYSESHEFVKVEGDFGYVGITDYAQHELGNVVYVDMPEVDDERLTRLSRMSQASSIRMLLKTGLSRLSLATRASLRT